MILLLPGNYKKDLAKFDSIYRKRKELLSDLKEVLWIDSELTKETFETELLNGIKHTNYSSSEQLFIDKNEKYLCFSSRLNNLIVDILKNNSNLNCYHYNFIEKKYTKISNVNLFCEIYFTLSKYFREQNIILNKVENIFKSKNNIDRIFYGIRQNINKGNRYYTLSYEDVFFLDSFLNYYEKKTKILIKKVSADYLLRSNLKETSRIRAKALFISDFYKLAKGDQNYIFGKVEMSFQYSSQIIFFDCGTGSDHEFLKDIKKLGIILPDSEKLFSDFNAAYVFLFLFEVLEKELGKELIFDRYELDFLDALLQKINIKRSKIPDIYYALKSMIPFGNNRVEILGYSFWYQLVFNLKLDNLEQAPQTEEYGNMISETKEPEETENIELINTSKAIEMNESKPPNRIERNGEVIKIFFNNDPIVLQNNDLIGLHYIYLIIKYSDNSKPLEAIDLCQKLMFESRKGNFNNYSVTNNDQTNTELDNEMHQQVFESTNHKNYKDIDEEEVNEDYNENESDSEDGDYLDADDNPTLGKRGKISNAISKDRYDASSKTKSTKTLKLKLTRKNKIIDELKAEIENLENLYKKATNPTHKNSIQRSISQKTEEFSKVYIEVEELKSDKKIRAIPEKRAYDAVIISINRAISKIKESNEEVGILLDKSVHRKSIFFYDPPPERNHQFHIYQE